MASNLLTPSNISTSSKNVRVKKVTYKGSSLQLKVCFIRGAYEGVLKEKGTIIEGEWNQGGSVFPLVPKSINKAPEMSKPQDPVKPYPYDEEEIIFENKNAGVRLAGTLTLPRTEEPFPAVLLVSGSGQQDRNEEVFGHRPFLVLADYLTRQGIAVLRVDDRGVGSSTGDISHATTEDFVEDALAGVEFLKSRRGIDPAQIGLIGHSEGGLIAPMVAVRNSDVAFIVLLAGPGLTGEKIIYLQSALIAEAAGVNSGTIARNRVLQEKIFSVVKEEENNTIAAKKLRRLMVEALANMSEEDKQNFGYTEIGIDAQVQVLISPWMRYFLTYNPRLALEKVEVPVLVINGEKDLQVPPEENLRAIEEALAAGGNRDYTIKKMPGLNHLLQTAGTGSPSEYATIQETMSPAVLKLIGDWILEHILETGD